MEGKNGKWEARAFSRCGGEKTQAPRGPVRKYADIIRRKLEA